MKTEKQKMLAGELYNALDKEISDERMNTRLLLKRLNETAENEAERRAEILKQLLPNASEGLWIQPPFYCDYGYNMKIGEKVFC
jgi:maltose O-acetyltransferase